MRIGAFSLWLVLLVVLTDVEARRRNRKYQMKMKRLQLRLREKRSIDSADFLPTDNAPEWNPDYLSKSAEMDYAHNVLGSKKKYLIHPPPHRPSIDNAHTNEDPLEAKYDLSNHESLEQMFSIEPVHHGISNVHDSNIKKYPPSQSDHNGGIPLHQGYDTLIHDQVFVPKNNIKTGHSDKKVITKSTSKKQRTKVAHESISCETGDIDHHSNLTHVLSIHGNNIRIDENQSNEQRRFPENILQTEQLSLEDDFSKEHSSTNSINNSQNHQGNPLNNVDAKKHGSDGTHNLELDENIPPGAVYSSHSLPEVGQIHSESDGEKTQSLLDNKIWNDLINTEEEKSLKSIDITDVSGSIFKSFVFNPNAQPLEMFQKCATPKNESGNCRYVQHCMLPTILSSIQHFMENACIIQRRFIGVCCPDFPVASELVKWPSGMTNFSHEKPFSVKVPEDCGVGTNTRIVGGSNADRKAWPWMVALLDNKKKFFCGGSLLNDRYVLTAAHCTFGTPRSQIVARLGEYDFTQPREPHDDYLVVEIKRHGQYTQLSLRNDIALLRLEKPVVFNEFVRTICLPESNTDFIGETATLVGWGHLDGATKLSSDILQEAHFPIISNSQCTLSHGVPVPSTLICAAAEDKEKGACNGDSGGPLMLLDSNERWKVIGIVSWGRRGCNPKFPTVYTRVNHYLDWIKRHST